MVIWVHSKLSVKLQGDLWLDRTFFPLHLSYLILSIISRPDLIEFIFIHLYSCTHILKLCYYDCTDELRMHLYKYPVQHSLGNFIVNRLHFHSVIQAIRNTNKMGTQLLWSNHLTYGRLWIWMFGSIILLKITTHLLQSENKKTSVIFMQY